MADYMSRIREVKAAFSITGRHHPPIAEGEAAGQ
jgi:hypothetical protein